MSSVRVYVNGRGVDAPEGATAVEAVRAIDAELASAIQSGDRALTDSRGLPVPAESLVYLGAIFRVVANRSRAEGGSPA